MLWIGDFLLMDKLITILFGNEFLGSTMWAVGSKRKIMVQIPVWSVQTVATISHIVYITVKTQGLFHGLP